ncbi:MAG TPA: hypothetical protein VM940_16130 [Chthoniobacterales bacterium]|nr:hypothetical protein [Chthoniobacterales bacterium]
MNGTARRAFLDRVEAGDALLFIYVAVIVRQAASWLPVSNAIAWTLATIGAGTFLWYYASTRTEERHRTALPFWLLIGVPMLFVYSLRLSFPDVSFDVLNYRLFHGIRGLSGPLYGPGDFFPTPAPYNTAPDMAMGITRIFFGYRLGTVINLFALLWAARITERLLRAHLTNSWLRHFAVLAIFAAEHLFFEINTYMIDLLAVPLLLEATRLALANFRPEARTALLVRIAFLLGLSVAFKLINVVSAIPIAALAGWRFLRDYDAAPSPREFATMFALSFGAFLAPVLPFTIYLYQEMGSPVFPILNGVFKSPFWPANSGWDNRWGPFGFWEVLVWPVKIFFRPERLSELLVYSGRLSLGYIAACLAWLLAWHDPTLRRLSFITLAGLLLWSAGTGYIRYAFFLELSAGLVLVMLTINAMRRPRLVPLAIAVLSSLGVQTVLACRYTGKTEWSGRATVFHFPAAWKRDTQYLLRDRSLRAFNDKSNRTRFAQVEVWIESSMKTASLEILLNGKAPVIGLRSWESFSSPEARRRFVHSIEAAAGKRMFTICFVDDLPDALKNIADRGLIAGERIPLEVPFYSVDHRLPLLLIEVSGAEVAAAAMRKTL